jgi:hypothetical protein
MSATTPVGTPERALVAETVHLSCETPSHGSAGLGEVLVRYTLSAHQESGILSIVRGNGNVIGYSISDQHSRNILRATIGDLLLFQIILFVLSASPRLT